MWALKSQSTNRIVKGLTLGELQAVIAVLSPEQQSQWFVWRSGWPNWKPLNQIGPMPAFEGHEMKLQESNMTMNEPQAPPPRETEGLIQSMVMRGIEDDLNPEQESSPEPAAESDDFDIEVAQKEYIQREHKRYNKRFSVRISIGEKSFETFSDNISAGGIKLTDPLPNWVIGYFNVHIKHPKTNQVVEHAGFVVENQDPENRVRISFAPFKKKETQTQLENWIKAA